MLSTDAADVVIRNTPTAVVGGATFYDSFVSFPITPVVQWMAGIWILIQAGFYLYDRYKRK
ncbi:hypothetical protein BF7_00220 [Pseudomonas phage Bf7]|uniref:Uncharacterized protein n=1 Tax=Pseudomonas phage Bf7 TaxID=1100790 RepID=H2ELY0_9CAUD|nr:holin [Pseudomonas phage Bf7]AEX65882.1 hypothetical protein BF7_00220 [Pseudomonas phage Bf7]